MKGHDVAGSNDGDDGNTICDTQSHNSPRPGKKHS